MEIVNFLFLILFINLFFYTSIIFKLQAFFVTSMLISIYNERNNFKNSDNYIALIVYKILYFFIIISNQLNNFYDNYRDSRIILFIEAGMYYINYLFVSGRNRLLNDFLNMTRNVLMDQRSKVIEQSSNNEDKNILLNQKKNTRNIELKHMEIDNNVFKDDNDMMSFLDDLDNKKKD